MKWKIVDRSGGDVLWIVCRVIGSCVLAVVGRGEE